MASPKLEVFFVFDSNGNPRTGIAGSMSFLTFKDDLGANLSAPTITEIGGGAYKFTLTFTDPNRGIVYLVHTGTGSTPERYYRFARPEETNMEDNIQAVKQVLAGKWKIFTTGGDANRLVIYDTDGTTVLYKFDLKDAAGIATTVNPYQRIPV